MGCEKLSLAERFLKEFEGLPEDKQKVVIDFIEFLKMKDKNELGKLMDTIIEENRQALGELGQ
jgi:hypothetical protein